jgi:16S rRNA (guanine527-N7)-methyltransferase
LKLLREFLSEELNIENTQVIEKFELYNKYVLDWNKKVNLISRKMTSIESNVINSIFFLTIYDIQKSKKIVDIGTGGGFPGVPLAILYPKIKFTLIDSIGKKINALSDIIRKLGLKNTECECGRAEDISLINEFSKEYDIVISKSVSALTNLYSWGKDFLNKNGAMISIKGGNLNEELSELRKVKNIQYEVLKFDFKPDYKIEGKQLVIIKPLNLNS